MLCCVCVVGLFESWVPRHTLVSVAHEHPVTDNGIVNRANIMVRTLAVFVETVEGVHWIIISYERMNKVFNNR